MKFPLLKKICCKKNVSIFRFDIKLKTSKPQKKSIFSISLHDKQNRAFCCLSKKQTVILNLIQSLFTTFYEIRKTISHLDPLLVMLTPKKTHFIFRVSALKFMIIAFLGRLWLSHPRHDIYFVTEEIRVCTYIVNIYIYMRMLFFHEYLMRARRDAITQRKTKIKSLTTNSNAIEQHNCISKHRRVSSVSFPPLKQQTSASYIMYINVKEKTRRDNVKNKLNRNDNIYRRWWSVTAETRESNWKLVKRITSAKFCSDKPRRWNVGREKFQKTVEAADWCESNALEMLRLDAIYGNLKGVTVWLF